MQREFIENIHIYISDIPIKIYTHTHLLWSTAGLCVCVLNFSDIPNSTELSRKAAADGADDTPIFY